MLVRFGLSCWLSLVTTLHSEAKRRRHQRRGTLRDSTASPMRANRQVLNSTLQASRWLLPIAGFMELSWSLACLPGPVYLGKLISKRKNKEYIPWEERTSVLEEEALEQKKKEEKKEARALKFKDGALYAAAEEDSGKQWYGAFKAEKLMRSAVSL